MTEKKPTATTPTTARPGKKEIKAAALEREARIFRETCERLGVSVTRDAGPRFGVTRQTLSRWINGETNPPRDALFVLLEMSNAEAAKRREALETMRERINAGLAAAADLTDRRNGR